jgi:hypothetical protein
VSSEVRGQGMANRTRTGRALPEGSTGRLDRLARGEWASSRRMSGSAAQALTVTMILLTSATRHEKGSPTPTKPL